jgi:DNA primase
MKGPGCKSPGLFYICNMIKGKRKELLSTELILSKVTEYDIFRWYMPNKSWKLNRITYSPFRNEQHPSFIIGNRYGRLNFIDFADTSKRGDCFDFVKLLFNLSSITDALKMIDRDFGLGISSQYTGEYKRIVAEYKQPESVEKQYSLIQASVRKFTAEELAYWNLYHQDEQDLKKENIYSIRKLYFNKQLFPLKETELRFGYFYDGHWKIYRPFGDKKSKWVPNNVPITTMDGKDNIINCNVAFINKSKKDYMVMKKVFPCSCAVQNEGLGCFSNENVEFLKANSDRQILSFDSDVTGVANSQQITKLFDFDYLNVPKQYLKEGIKDWADLAKTYGLKAIEDYLKQKQLL